MKTFLAAVAGLILSVAACSAASAQHYLYVASPGIRNYVEYGGVGVLVYDIDNGYKFVRRIPTWEVPPGKASVKRSKATASSSSRTGTSSAIHGGNGSRRIAMDVRELFADDFERLGGLHRQLLDLVGNDGEPLAGRARPRRPINGVLLTVSVQDLLALPPDQRKEQAARLRGRMQELQQRLGVKVPVYVLVTKCDLLAGFNELFENT